VARAERPSKRKKFSDIWEQEEEQEPEFHFLKKPSALKAHRVSIPSTLPAVEISAPGFSYNPDYDQHQDVLGEALAETLKQREKKTKNSETTSTFPHKQKDTRTKRKDICQFQNSLCRSKRKHELCSDDQRRGGRGRGKRKER